MFYFDKFNAQYKSKVGTMVTRTTYLRYELAKSRLVEFLKQEHHGIVDVPFKEINTVFLQDFYLFLRNTHRSGNNNAMKTMQHVRAVFNYIKNTGENFADPFANFKMSFEKKERDYLEQEELSVLQNKQFGSERLERVRDIFIEICCIDKKITFHVARHTFATLCLTMGMPIESISKMLGHTKIKTTQIYA